MCSAGGFTIMLLQEWVGQYKSYNRNVRLFLLANFFVQASLGIFMVVYNFYIRELGYNEEVNGQVIAMTALATAIILIPAGILSDKLGRKKLMIYSVLGTTIILFIRSILVTDLSLLVIAFAAGISMAFFQVTSIPWLAENSTQKQRVHLFSFHFALMMGSSVFGNLFGGLISDLFLYTFGFNGLWSVRLTLFLAAIVNLIGILPLGKMEEIKIKKEKTSNSIKAGLEFLKTNKSGFKFVMLFVVAQAFIGCGSGLVIPYLNLYFADRFQVSNGWVGMILSLGQAATAIAMFIGPAVVRKFGEVRAVVFLQLASIPFLLITAYTQNIWLAVVGFLLRQALMNAGNPIQMSIMMEKVDDKMKGLANSMSQMVFQLGWATMGPISTSIVAIQGAYYGYAYVFTITSILYVIGATYFFFVFGIKKKDRLLTATT